MQEVYKKTLEQLKKKQTFGKSETIPGQTYSIRELLIRFQNGQRLCANVRPVNPWTRDGIGDDDIDLEVPSAGNFEELMLAQQEVNSRSSALKQRLKEQQEKKDPTVEQPPTGDN